MSIRRDQPLFSLADQLFNPDTVATLARGLKAAYPGFRQGAFEREALARFPELALKARISCLVDGIEAHLPREFAATADILTQALPAPLDPDKTDDDFGHFIWAAPAEWVARHGCQVDRLPRSFLFLEAATQRFSVESAIRPFLSAYPEQTMTFITECARHDNYHVRRLASEGIRPYLPWAQKVVLPPAQIINVLEGLYDDETRYVTRSVANTLNDLSKDHPELVVSTLRNWQAQQRQQADELSWMTRHALRTLTKAGHAGALELLGYPAAPAFSVSGVEVDERVVVGDSLVWRGRLRSRARQRLKISLKIHFLKADGAHAVKVFAIKDVALGAGEALDIEKSIAFKPLSTRTLYAGKHAVEIDVNGISRCKRFFDLVA